MFEKAWLWVLLLSLAVSLAISWRTQVKGKGITLGLLGLAAGSTLARALGFFIVISAPLFRQPRLEMGLLLPVTGSFIGILGAVLVLMAMRELSRTSFSGPRGIPSRVITTGPYRFVRHPATIGFVATYLGWCFAWGALYALYSVPAVAVVMVLENLWEESNLVRVVGKDYLDYRRKVGMFFPRRRRL